MNKTDLGRYKSPGQRPLAYYPLCNRGVAAPTSRVRKGEDPRSAISQPYEVGRYEIQRAQEERYGVSKAEVVMRPSTRK